jgi:hypothetical protein
MKNLTGRILKSIGLAAIAVVTSHSLVMANTIRGQVMNSQGSAVSGWIVTASSKVCGLNCIDVALQTRTDSSGSFSFIGVPLSIEPLLGSPKPTPYTLQVAAPGMNATKAAALQAAPKDWSDVVNVSVNVQ